jgi:hypothetical protein
MNLLIDSEFCRVILSSACATKKIKHSSDERPEALARTSTATPRVNELSMKSHLFIKNSSLERFFMV